MLSSRRYVHSWLQDPALHTRSVVCCILDVCCALFAAAISSRSADAALDAEMERRRRRAAAPTLRMACRCGAKHATRCTCAAARRGPAQRAGGLDAPRSPHDCLSMPASRPALEWNNLSCRWRGPCGGGGLGPEGGGEGRRGLG